MGLMMGHEKGARLVLMMDCGKVLRMVCLKEKLKALELLEFVMVTLKEAPRLHLWAESKVAQMVLHSEQWKGLMKVRLMET